MDLDTKFSKDDLTKLAIIAWNEPISKVIETANKYKTIGGVITAYRDSYGYNEKGETLFPYNLAIEGYNKYIK